MEIVVKKLETGIIEINYDDIKKYLIGRLEKYEGLTYDEETIGDAKKDRATLNKLKGELDDKRKDIKKKCLVPYTEFELKVNELKGLVDSPMLKIDDQVKAYEEFLRSEKMKEVLWVYEDNIGDLKEILPYAKIENDKWLNATYKMATVIKDIKEVIETTKTHLELIDNLDTEFKFEIKHKYLDTLDITIAMREKEKLEQNKKNLDELAKKKEETGEIIEEKNIIEEPKKEGITVYSFNLRIQTTVDKKDLLKRFLIDNEIDFEVK